MDRDLNLYNELKATAEEIASVEDKEFYFKSGSVMVIDTDKLSNYGENLLGWVLRDHRKREK